MNKHEPTPKATQLNLKDPETRALAEEVARNHHTSLNSAVKEALREKLERDAEAAEERYAKMMAIVAEMRAFPIKDHRAADEIIGYDENGLPT